MLPTHRPPTSPGEILREEFLVPLGMTQLALAERLGVHVQQVNLLVNDKRAVTAETALRLAEVFGTSPEFWLYLQLHRDLWNAKQARAATASRQKASRATTPRKASKTTGRAARPGRRRTATGATQKP